MDTQFIPFSLALPLAEYSGHSPNSATVLLPILFLGGGFSPCDTINGFGSVECVLEWDFPTLGVFPTHAER